MFRTTLNQFLNKRYSQGTIDQFEKFLTLLHQWNKVYNLTAINDPKEMVIHHILDSLSISPYLHGNQIIDVGTGAGLPGIPLAITHPDQQFVLLDSVAKKTRFLTQVKIELGLQNVEVINQRVEDYHPEVCFTSVISRAFSSLNKMIEKTKHLCCQQGYFLAMKGVYPENELRELTENIKLDHIEKLEVPGLNAERHLVLLVND